MIEKLVREIFEDLEDGSITVESLHRLLETSLQLFPKLIDVELKAIKDIKDMKGARGRNEYERYNLTSGIVHAENGLIGIQDRIAAMADTIIALREILSKELPFIKYVEGKPVLVFTVCPSPLDSNKE